MAAAVTLQSLLCIAWVSAGGWQRRHRVGRVEGGVPRQLGYPVAEGHVVDAVAATAEPVHQDREQGVLRAGEVIGAPGAVLGGDMADSGELMTMAAFPSLNNVRTKTPVTS